MGDKPKLAPKPKLLSTPLPQSLLPEVDQLRECEEMKKHEREMWNRGSCINNYEECDSRRAQQNQFTAPVNIHSSLTLRRQRTKAPKPLPYLKPISSYLTQGQLFAGRSSQRRKKVTFAVKYQRRRRKSEKLPPRPELAYLVVDLSSGTLFKTSDEPLKGATCITSQKLQKSSARLRMSLAADGKPMPLPRRRPGEGVEYSTPESSRIDKEPSPPPILAKPVWKPTSVLEDQVSPTVCSQSNEHHSTVCQNQQQLGERESCSPPWDSVNVSLKRPMPVPRNMSINSAIQSSSETPSTSNTMSKPPAALPPHGDDVPSKGTFPAEDDMPPALPVKSALSREIQRSIKNKPQFSNEPQLPTKPYMSHENLDINMSMEQNNSYGFQQIEESPLTSTSELTTDTTEPLYIDPLQSQQLPSSGKSKPARPPPPSSSAIRKAQQRRAGTLASRPLKSSKSPTFHHFDLHSTMNSGHGKSSTSNTPFSTSLSPSRSVLASKTAPYYEVVDAEPQHSVYELDDPTSPVPPSYPPSLHISNQYRKLSSESDTGTAPALPPRAPNSGFKKMQHRTTKPIPSGFTQTHSGVDLPSTRHTSTPSGEWNNNWKREEKEPEIDEDSVYEPVDASMPLPPQRTKKNIRGTRTTTSVSHNHNIHPKKNLSQKEDVGSVKSTPTPRKVLCSHSQQVNKLALTVTTPQSRLKTSRSIPGGAEEDFAAKLSRLSMQDVRDVEGPVAKTKCFNFKKIMNRWKKENLLADMPDMYVDMQPGGREEEEEEEEEEDGPCMASSDVLNRKPDLRTIAPTTH